MIAKCRNINVVFARNRHINTTHQYNGLHDGYIHYYYVSMGRLEWYFLLLLSLNTKIYVRYVVSGVVKQ